jgi:hypothetical protein
LNLEEYFLKSKGITLFDTLLVAVIAVFIVSLLKQSSILFWKAIVITAVRVIHFFKKDIPSLITKTKDRKSYKENLKRGEITYFLYAKLMDKKNKGTISKIEKQALERSYDKHHKTYEKIGDFDYKKIVENQKKFPKI